ncbi:hypothetical protein ACMYR3_11125 [Ampullimonas aquatilis]|uniref:hypothetical protein n=1 Tax=Ampullimonas aquatilis TaxID=1341549 RepID=UPI003C77791C
MAARSFRVSIRNLTQNLVLSQSFNHMCQGNWTTGQAPPGVIGFANPGDRNTIYVLPNQDGTGGFQSESDDAFGGTEGYVKYDVYDAFLGADKPVGMIYLYWNNPFYGVTHCRFVANPTDVTPDCDYSGTSGSRFQTSAAESLPFSFIPSNGVVNATDNKGMFPVIGDVDGEQQAADFAAGTAAFLVGGPVAGVADLAALTGIVDHAWIRMDLLDGPPEAHHDLTGPSQPATYSRNLTPTAEEWTGHWSSNTVSIQIASDSTVNTEINRFIPMIISLSDSSTMPPIKMNLSVNLGGQILQHPIPRMETPMNEAPPTSSHTDPHSGSATFQHLKQLSEAAAEVPLSGNPNLGKLHPRLIEEMRDDNGTTYANGIIYLPNAITLRLYDLFTGNTKSGEQVVYQRIGSDSKVVINQPLIRQIKIS